ncbi:putative methyltransferase PMT26 [Abeliophyllum distichum]|uniref:Methyltransferase n=1 Tax=Abeliophyllum distichum TaxID=126358 RepID=A0ABD1SD15_9LAMI
MALGKYSRVDGRKSSSGYCSTVTIVVFVALCLVGVWMMTSSSVVPVQNSDVSQENKNEVRTHVRESNDDNDNNGTNNESGNIASDDSISSDDGKTKQFEDNPGDLPEDATKGDSHASSSQEEKNGKSEETEKTTEENPEEKSKYEKKEYIEEKKEDEEEKNGEEKKEDGESQKENKDSETAETNENNSDDNEKKSEESSGDAKDGDKGEGQIEEKVDEKKDKESDQVSGSFHQLSITNIGRGTVPEKPPTCLVPVPEGYQRSIEWPRSREKIWYHNVPHTKLAEVKGHQNWVKVSGEYLTFPGGGTQFKHGALHYIDFIQQSVPDIAWGKRSRVVLDVGCGVASFGGFLFDRDVLTMSLAPKDEHEAQVQFALERGIPGISAVMGTMRLPYPARVFDIVHCARCRVPWHIEGGKLLLELNRLLRPGGFFVWSATPIYQKLAEDAEIWEAMKKLTKAMCWEVVSITKDRVNGVGIAIYRKPTSNQCYEQRSQNDPPLCKDSDDPNAAWNVLLQACMHKLPVDSSERGAQWPKQWPARLGQTPYWLSSSQVGVYGKPAPEDFTADYEHWKRVVSKSYLNGLGIDWSNVRNVMDMRAVYGGFAAALKDLNLWVMNIVSIDAPDTLPIIYERGLFGTYHNWCESFSTYPRSYDLLHADHLFSKIKNKCNFMALVAEADRILRPEGKLIVRDTVEIINELESLLKSMHWDIRMTYSKNKEGMLCAQKTMWRPKETETISYAIA